tara:strand:+ start:250 stop:1158 length:909 start_codon:yes stop_codon:yes gene_type:complete
MIKILINTSTFGNDNLKLLKNKKKFKFIINKTGRKVSESYLKKNIKNVHAIIAGTEQYDSSILAYAKNLKLISRLGVGTDNIDLVFCKKNNIKVLTSKVDLSIGVAEQALSLIFAGLKKISYFDKSIKFGKWKKEYTSLLFRKKIGIIGFGKIGKKIYQLTKPFDLKYFYNDKIKISSNGLKFISIKSMFEKCDIITIHLPFNKRTHHIINKKVFPKKNSKIILVNTSRGQVINERDLINFLYRNKQSFAGLDVFEKEPYEGKLKKLNNSILTPHVSGYSLELRNLMEKEALKNLLLKFGGS